MNKWIAIVETAKDSKLEKHANLPPDYPLLCKEYETEEQAREENPGKTVMSIEEYRGYNWGMNLLYNHIEATPKAQWWKFWVK